VNIVAHKSSKGGKAGRGHVIDMPRSKWHLR
jgi:hypothetical protein